MEGSMSQIYRTKKEAKENGLLTADEWASMRLKRPCKEIYKAYAPLVGATGQEVKDEIYYTKEQVEEIISATEAKKRKRQIIEGVKPYRQASFNPGRATSFSLFRLSDTVEK